MSTSSQDAQLQLDALVKDGVQKRDVFADPATRIRALEGNHRLHHKWEVFDARKKRSVIANTAVARELASWCWSLAAPLQQGEQAPGGRMNAA